MLQPCPKCGYTRQVYDSHIQAGLCPACGIAIEKWLKRSHREIETPAGVSTRYKEIKPWLARFKSVLLSTPEKVDAGVFYSRAVLYALFFLWGWWFILKGMVWSSIGGSFLHSVNLPFHEFGHILFSPFGGFMTLLGGSLFQVLLPLGLGAVFLWRYEDNFAASIMLWWSGQNFIDVSPYIADASFRTIPLIGGLGMEAHDWGNLLTMLDWLNYDYALGRASFVFGSSLMVVANAWGGYLLYLQKERLR